MTKHTLTALTTVLALAAGPVFAQSQGDWTIGLGIGNVNPKSDNGTLAGAAATIDSATQLTFTAEYFVRDNIGIELLAATPFEHTVSIAGVGNATTKQLPPTLSVNYHMPLGNGITPFVGIGLNYTTFFEEASALGAIDIDDSFGLALQVGADIAVSERSAIRVNARYINIEADVSLNGTPIGTAEIDPLVLGVAYILKF